MKVGIIGGSIAGCATAALLPRRPTTGCPQPMPGSRSPSPAPDRKRQGPKSLIALPRETLGGEARQARSASEILGFPQSRVLVTEKIIGVTLGKLS